MNEFEFIWLMIYMLGGFAIVGVALMIIETLALKLFPHKYWKEDSITKELDLLYLELQLLRLYVFNVRISKKFKSSSQSISISQLKLFAKIN